MDHERLAQGLLGMTRLHRPWLVLTCSVGLVACSSGAGPETHASGDGGHTASTDNSEPIASGGAAAGSGGANSTSSGGSRASGGNEAEDGTGGSIDTASGGQTSDGDPPPELSPGCGTSSDLASGKNSIDVDGTTREFILTLPTNYDSKHPYRLVFGFHGRMYDAEWVANGESPLTGPYFGMLEQSEGSAIFVAPQALSTSWSNQDGRDIAFVEEMLDTLQAKLCVDRSRVFATGFSYGAIMTATIGCELYDRFQAVAPMSASLPESCSDELPGLAYWGSHGLKDQTIQLVQGEAVRDSYIARNHCESTPGPADENGCVSYPGCDEGAPTVWCTFTGEHVPAPFAGPGIWPFFAQF